MNLNSNIDFGYVIYMSQRRSNFNVLDEKTSIAQHRNGTVNGLHDREARSQLHRVLDLDALLQCLNAGATMYELAGER